MSGYMTIIHNMVDDMPELKDRWKGQRVLLFQLTETAKALSKKHQSCLADILDREPGSNHSVASSIAMEIATQEIREELMATADGPASIDHQDVFLDPQIIPYRKGTFPG